MALTLDGTNGIVSSGSITTQSATGVIFSDSSSLPAASSPYVLKNRIINGAMVIDQRNAGASVTIPATASQYTLDRWTAASVSASKYSVQQNAGSITPPAGFSNYLGVTSLAATTLAATDYYFLAQPIEGFNISDLGFGTANAKTVTLSFWVRSSLTGTFGGAIQNNGSLRTYPFSYSIPTANTWTQISITIAGDTTGTWLTTNGVGLNVMFSLGMGSTFSGTANTWSSTNYLSTTGAVSVVGTSSATFYITGVQLEQNTSATPFERRLYNQELANCQRYYWKRLDTFSNTAFATVACYSASDARGPLTYTQMRTAPVISFSGSFFVQVSSAVQPTVTSANMTSSQITDQTALIVAATSGLTIGQAGVLIRATGTCFIDASAEF